MINLYICTRTKIKGLIMLKIKLALILTIFLISSYNIYSNPPEKDKETEKITLSFLEVTDPAIKFSTSDINMMIMRKSKGYLYPATKLLLTKEDGKLLFIVTAIDNSWCNMFCKEETVHGYTTVQGRLFIIATKGNIPEEFDRFFILNKDVNVKTFSKSSETDTTIKNPVWTYLHRGEDKMATVLKSVYTEKLGR